MDVVVTNLTSSLRSPTSDPGFLVEIRKLPCMACGRYGAEAHHVKTVGSGGGDDAWNVIPLCPEHHKLGSTAWHKGPRQFLLTYPWVWTYLQSVGWEMLNGSLFHPNHADEIGILRQKVYRKKRRVR